MITEYSVTRPKIKVSLNARLFYCQKFNPYKNNILFGMLFEQGATLSKWYSLKQPPLTTTIRLVLA